MADTTSKLSMGTLLLLEKPRPVVKSFQTLGNFDLVAFETMVGNVKGEVHSNNSFIDLFGCLSFKESFILFTDEFGKFNAHMY